MQPTFVDYFLEWNEHSESPKQFFIWSAYAAISAVLRDKVHITLSVDTIYPNIYVIITSTGSSEVRKGVPVKRAKKLIRRVNNTKMISGQASIQGIMDRLSMPYVYKGQNIQGAAGVIIAEELREYIVDIQQANPVLTSWYDGQRDGWENLLRKEQKMLDNICPSMLAASNEEYFRDVFDVKAMTGGLLARSLIVHGAKVEKRDSLMYAPKPSKELEDKAFEELRRISTLSGEVGISDEARKFYDEWYHAWYSPLNMKDFSGTGIESRIHTTMLKVAMLMSINERKRIIDKTTIENAIDSCIALMANYKRIIRSSGESPIRRAQNLVLGLIARQPKFRMKKTEVLRDLWGEIDNEILDKIIMTLEGADIAKVRNYSGDPYIEFTARTIKQYEEITKG